MASAAKRARVVLRSPAEALEANLEAQRAYPDKMKALQRRHEAERRRQEAEIEGLCREEAELKRREAELRTRTGLAPIAIRDLPANVLNHILLGCSDNLLRFVAACARVCAEWRRVVGGSAAYGLALPRGRREGMAYVGDDGERADLPAHNYYRGTERARVLKVTAEALAEVGNWLDLGDKQIADAAVAVLGAALQAMPRIRFTELSLGRRNELTAVGVASLVPALRRPWGDRGLKKLTVSHNPLGDAGVAALAKALPPTLERLEIHGTDCGDDGLVALAAALPALTHLETLRCGNPAATARGWVVLAGALPSLPALRWVDVDKSLGMGPEGAAALSAAVPNCPQLRYLFVQYCGLGEEDTAMFRALGRSPGDADGQLAVSATQRRS